MRLKTLFLLFGLILCTTALVNCSRESSIKENVNLRNNHSVVFVYKTPFENPDAFADSIINLPNPDSVIVSDTITVTIGDTLHMMGFLRYNSDKIYLYQWILDSLVTDSTGKSKMKKALVTGRNATPQSWVYMKEGVYSPLFVAIDGNNATDTAGKDQFIRVINTPPYLGVPKDTLWTRAKSSITFPILALDSFGTIASFKVDVDANGKREAKDWKYTKSDSSDSLAITIPYDSTLTDSIGNQKIYIIVTDDDKNTTKDSVFIHFNQLPTIKILGPDDQQRISDSVESFRLFYEGHDKDNEDQLRYYVRVAATPDNQDDDLNLSNVYDLVLKNSTSTSFTVIENGENALKNLGYTARYFSWDVWVTDGYDTVVAEKIKIGKGKQRPRYFYLGPSKSTCDFTGTAKFEGLSAHSGIKITLVNIADTNNLYTTTTNSKGEFRASDLPAGTFKLTATDETGHGFLKVTTRTPNINAGDEKELPPILLKDPAPPRIYNVKGFEDTMTVRSWEVSGRFSDYGSQVKTAVAVLGKDTCNSKNNRCHISNLSSYAWSVAFASLADGKYTFKITATDSAGYHTDTTFTFVVAATNISITVNDASSAMAGDADTLFFKANVAEAKPAVNKVTWKTNVPGDSPRTISVSEGVALIKLTKEAFPGATANTRYTMQAIADNGAVSNIVRFGFYDNGPMVNIDAPAYDTTITLNDEITLHASVVANNKDGTDTKTLVWTCIEGNSKTDNCFAADNLAPQKSWTTAGVKKIAIKVTNKDNDTATDTLQVNVIADPPTIKVDDNEDVINKKVNAKHKFEYTAKDKYGTITEVAWKCGSGTFNATSISTPQSEITSTMEIQLPNKEATNYKCVVRATDDDNQSGYDTLKFNIIKDIPTIRLDIQGKDVTIKDQEQLKYTASNTLGGTIYVDYICGNNLSNLKLSTWNSAWQGRNGVIPTAVMPDTAGEYYCVMRAVDEEEKDLEASAATLYSLDTATYRVFKAPPTVTLNESYVRTIKDTLTLYANAKDSAESWLPGRIISYEWGCGPSSQNVANTLVSTGKNTYKVTLPDKPQNNYLCIVQVMDDDSLTARDTTRFTVELAPPTVKVVRDSAVIRAGFSIVLDATAYDLHENLGLGYIAKREWSCGANAADINKNWKKVSSFDTTWMAPSASVNYYCVARVTDDDGNIATDTMYLKYSTDVPVISVAESQINVVQGDVFFLDASINNVWQGINWYSWQCFYADSSKEAEKPVLLTYSGRFYSYRETLSSAGRDLYCVISAQEKATGAIFSDTSHVKVLTAANDLPIGRITAVDTIYPWSGDDAQSDEALYYYSPEWSGAQSKIGTIGNNNLREYFWRFSNVSGTFYKGKADGTLDTTIAQFNDAFRRPINEGSFSVCLDFRDSIKANADEFFMKRHQAPTACRTVYVQRAWKNIANTNDTVLEYSEIRTPPAITTIGNKLSVAYINNSQAIVSKNYNGSSWTSLNTSAISFNGTITALRMANNGSDLFLAILTSGNELKVYKSNSGTSAWAAFGNTITGATSVNITCHPTSGNPVVTYAKNSRPYFNYWKNNAWESKAISDTLSARDVNAVFSSKGILLTTITDNTYLYNTYYAIYDGSTNNYTRQKAISLINREMSSISLVAEDSTIYMGYLNRSSVIGEAGPYVRRFRLSSGSISQVTEKNLQEGMLPANIRVAARNGKVYAIIDDNGRGLSHCHAYFFNGTQWKPYGENQLPYFKGPFYSTHGYNLYGFSPNIAVANNGMVYISMISWPNTGAASLNKGPIFMKNISESWTINTKP